MSWKTAEKEVLTRINKLLADAGLDGQFEAGSVYTNDKTGFDIHLESKGYMTLKFSHLDALAEAFKTKRINIEGSTRQTGYCESCRGTEAVIELTVEEAQV
jgi:uncharacterized SAM-dependent methyltransferase